jgi:hypothetical protein
VAGGDQGLLAEACEAALCLIALLRFWSLGLVRGKTAADETLLRIGASVWFCMMRARSSRRSQRLLRLVGEGPWQWKWEFLWHSSVVYVCLPMFPQFSKFGPLIYVGETDNFSRRLVEHMSRLLAPAGSVQQPFFQFVRGDCSRPDLLQLSVCEWLFFPVASAPFDAGLRKSLERQWIRGAGVLNPPRVHDLLRMRAGMRQPSQGLRLFDSARAVCRIRGGAASKAAVRPVCLKVKASRSVWKDGLRMTASALAGHRFPGCGSASLAAWRLARGPWVYVVLRVTNHEDGWRRRRGLHMLRRVASIRKDLPSPIALINCALPWVGSNAAKALVLGAVRCLISSWRQSGHWLPILRHARLRIQWSSTSTLGDLLCNGGSLASDLVLPARVCMCQQLLRVDASWPTVCVDGVVHIAASQGRVPWPSHLRKFASLPANLSLPPKRSQVVSQLRTFLRSFRDRCKLHDETLRVECVVADVGASLVQCLDKSCISSLVTWAEVALAREFLEPFFVQVFDHNLSRFGLFCPALVHGQACKALDFGPAESGTDFVWVPGGCEQEARVLGAMASVEGVPSHLQPSQLSACPKRSWSIGCPVLLPKWKAPGVKWRLVVNKHNAPPTGLHSAVSKAIDVALDGMPREAWSDFASALGFLELAAEFNCRAGSMFDDPCVWTEAADMVDCFHHLPCAEAASMWDVVSEFWVGLGILCLSVPKRKGSGPGKFGRYEEAGWVCFSLSARRPCAFCFHQFYQAPWLLGQRSEGCSYG